VQRLEELVQRFLPMAILVVAVAFVPAMMLAPTGLPRLRGLERELADVESENQDLRREIGRLQREVQHLRDDPAAIERIARDELGLVRKSEVVFQFPRAR
jgi:cell division protein FtsB